jgi:SAM-dependent methyltransferase
MNVPELQKPGRVGSVRAGYDQWAKVYDHDANPLLALEEPHVQRILGRVDGLCILDLGCGTGRHTSWLAAAGAQVTAVDFATGMLLQARRKTQDFGVSYVIHDLHDSLPYRAGAFDVVLSCLVLEHLDSLADFFANIYQVTAPGGRTVVSTVHPAMFLRGSQAQFTDPSSGDVVRPGSHAHSIGDCVMAAIDAGFELRGVEEFAPDAAFVSVYSRAEKYQGWPMLLLMDGVRPGH